MIHQNIRHAICMVRPVAHTYAAYEAAQCAIGGIIAAADPGFVRGDYGREDLDYLLEIRRRWQSMARAMLQADIDDAACVSHRINAEMDKEETA